MHRKGMTERLWQPAPWVCCQLVSPLQCYVNLVFYTGFPQFKREMRNCHYLNGCELKLWDGNRWMGYFFNALLGLNFMPSFSLEQVLCVGGLTYKSLQPRISNGCADRLWVLAMRMAPFHVTHQLEFLHQSFLAVPRDALGLGWVIGWWDQHLIRAFSQDNLMISKQLTQAGNVELSHVLVRDEDYQSWDMHGKKSIWGGWEGVERRACVETDGAGVLLCALGSPVTPPAGISDMHHTGKGGRCLQTLTVAGLVMGRFCWELQWTSASIFKSLWSSPSAKWLFLRVEYSYRMSSLSVMHRVPRNF